MNTIIACTDFSPNAANALQYAAALAQAAKARLVLFHYYNYPVPGSDLSGVFPTTYVSEIGEEDLNHNLRDIQQDLSATYKIDVDYVLRSFDFPRDLESVFKEENAQLVIMGLQGQNAVINAIVGTAPSGAIRRGKLPLLLIPLGAAFHPVQKILFACDDRGTNSSETLKAMLDIAGVFDSYIEVLTLFDLEKTPELVPAGDLSPAKSQLETRLTKVRHGYSYENEPEVDKGILYEATRSSADMVAMIPHHHSFLSSLFNQSETQRIASTIHLPLLVLGENVEA